MSIDQAGLDRLREELDRSLGDGPPLVPPADRLAAGRAAARRRQRFVMAGSAAAVAAVVVASFAITGYSDPGRQGADPLAPPTSTPPSSSSDAVTESERAAELDRLAAEARAHAERLRKAQLVSNQFPASLDPVDGSLVVKDGWEVVRRVPEPVGFTAPEKSLGVVVTKGATTRWMLLSLDQVYDADENPIAGEVSPSASADDPNKGYTRFEDWLASMVAISGGPPTEPLVVVSVDDEVTAGPGATLVDLQVIDVIEGYTAPGDRVAEVLRDGQTWFVVIRGHGAEADPIPVDSEVLPQTTLAALLTYLGQQAESGEGVR